VVTGIVLRATAPADPPAPDHSGFMEGEISIDEVGRRNHEWMEGSSRHTEATFRAHALISFGMSLGLVGGGLLLAASRKVRTSLAAMTAESAGIVARRIKDALTEDAPGQSRSQDQSPQARLEALASLHRGGHLSDQEFEAKRQQVIAQL
jgi:hypothetical protein